MEDAPEPERCDYCRLPRQAGTVTADVEGHSYSFCSEYCRDAMAGADRVFTRYHGHRRVDLGVAAIDAMLPHGLPRNSFVLVSAEPGTREMALQSELIWRTLQRDEPAVMVTFLEPPSSLVERFATLDWNVLPYLETGQLTVVDCFTYRMVRSEPPRDSTSAWTTHLAEAVEPATVPVRDPTDVAEVTNKIEGALDDVGAVETGLVTIDSLTEFGTLVQPVQAYDFVKDLRAIVSKARFVPVVAGATYLGNDDVFPHDLAYVADGVVDVQLNGDVDEGLVKQLRVRKLSGVPSFQRWRAYEFTAGRGMVTFDPTARGAESAGPEAPPPPPDQQRLPTRDASAEPDGDAAPASDGERPASAESAGDAATDDVPTDDADRSATRDAADDERE